jgi:hypothetical protein
MKLEYELFILQGTDRLVKIYSFKSFFRYG